MTNPTDAMPDTAERIASPPGRIWAIGVLVLSALVSMSMNTVHAFDATTLPKPLALMYGVAPVALAAMQSHAVALRALRKEKVGPFRRVLTFGLVLGGLGLSFLGIYDLLRHAVPDPIEATSLHEPAVFFSVVLDLMALAALHELLRESPSFVSAVQAAEALVVPAVPAAVGESPTVEAERVTETPAINLHSNLMEVEKAVEAPPGSVVPDPAIAVPAASESVTGDTLEAPPVVANGRETSSNLDEVLAPVPDPFTGVPPQVNGPSITTASLQEEVVDEPVFSEQVQPEPPAELDAPYRPIAVAKFLGEVASGEPPSVRTIKDRMGVGTDRARRLQSYLGGLVEVSR